MHSNCQTKQNTFKKQSVAEHTVRILNTLIEICVHTNPGKFSIYMAQVSWDNEFNFLLTYLRINGIFPKCNGNLVTSMNSVNLRKSMVHELGSIWGSGLLAVTCWLSGKDASCHTRGHLIKSFWFLFATEFIEFSKNYLGKTELSSPVNASRGAFLLVVSKWNHHIKRLFFLWRNARLNCCNETCYNVCWWILLDKHITQVGFNSKYWLHSQ